MHSHATEFVRAFSNALEASSGPNGDGRMRLTITFNVGDEVAAFAAVSSLIAERSEVSPTPAPDWLDALKAGDSPDTAGSRTYTNRHVAAMIREVLANEREGELMKALDDILEAIEEGRGGRTYSETLRRAREIVKTKGGEV